MRSPGPAKSHSWNSSLRRSRSNFKWPRMKSVNRPSFKKTWAPNWNCPNKGLTATSKRLGSAIISNSCMRVWNPIKPNNKHSICLTNSNQMNLGSVCLKCLNNNRRVRKTPNKRSYSLREKSPNLLTRISRWRMRSASWDPANQSRSLWTCTLKTQLGPRKFTKTR